MQACIDACMDLLAPLLLSDALLFTYSEAGPWQGHGLKCLLVVRRQRKADGTEEDGQRWKNRPVCIRGNTEHCYWTTEAQFRGPL